MNRVIGFGGLIGAGKSTAAVIAREAIIASGGAAYIIPFAKAVKDIAKLMGWDGVKDERGRRLLQTLGTEAGRTYDPDMWVKLVAKEAESLPETAIVICDDVRFPNEVNFCMTFGICLLLQGRSTPAPDVKVFEGMSNHASETSLPDTSKWTGTIYNGDDELTLKIRVESTLGAHGFLSN